MTPKTLPLKQPRFNHVLAFEVSKATVFVQALPGGTRCEIGNDRASIRRQIKTELRRNPTLGIGPLLVVCEATGSYGQPVLDCAVELGVACHRAHGSRVRWFAQSQARYAKSDPIDVGMIGRYASSTECLQLYRPPSPEESELRELMGRRTELRQTKEAEQARLEHVRSTLVRETIRDHIRALERQIDKIAARIDALIGAHARLQRAAELMQSVKGVGRLTAAAVLAYLPEIGTLSRATIAALAGLAPFDADSGKHKGPRHILGGRAEVRAALYMAAVVAMRCNPHLRAMAQRLQARGKPFKVAVTAVMRKLLVILNAIVASGEPCRMANAT
jgi:transposase